MGFPLEIVTLLATTIVGVVTNIWAASNKAKNEANQRQIEALGAQANVRQEAREYGGKDPAFAFTRRTIALSAILAIIVLPKVAALIFSGTPWVVTVGYTEVTGGFWNWLFGPDEVTKWQTFQGFVITPLDTHLVMAITGLYFGSSMSRNAR